MTEVTKRFWQGNAPAGGIAIIIDPPAKTIRVMNDGGSDLTVKIPAIGKGDTDILKATESEIYKDPAGGISRVELTGSTVASRFRVIEGSVS